MAERRPTPSAEMNKSQRGSGSSMSSKRAGVSHPSNGGKKKQRLAAEETGFDIFAQTITDGIYRLAGVKDNQKSPEQIARNCQSNAPRKINTNFQGALGKARKDHATPADTVSSAASTRTRSTSSNQSLQQSMPTAAKTPSAVDPDGESKIEQIGFSFADRGVEIVEQHKELKHSTRTLMYQRIFPGEIVRLGVDDEIIIQVPKDLLPRMETREKSDHKSLRSKLDKAMLSLHYRLVEFEREEQLEAEHNKRTVDVLNKPYFEFPCRIKNYAERHHLANLNPDKSAIQGLWSHGSGFYVELCGYSPHSTVLIMHRMLPFVRVFKIRSGSILNDASLGFPVKQNPDSLAVPLSRNLALAEGDATKSLEVLMRYYKALDRANKKRVASSKASQAPKAKSDEKSLENSMADSLLDELEETKLREFTKLVEKTYLDATEEMYSNFTTLKSYLVERSKVAELYEELKVRFPFAHAVLSILVSSQALPVELAPLFQLKRHAKKSAGDTEFEALLMFSSDENDSDFEPNHNKESDDDADDDLFGFELEDPSILAQAPMDNIDELETKERAVLHLFLSALKLKSQRCMMIWSSVQPMADYASGNRQNATKAIASSSCTLKTAWNNLDIISQRCQPRLKDAVRSQQTIGCTYDNHQEVISKKVQTDGKSAVAIRGTSMFLTKHKAFALPIDSIMVSPHGVKFKVTSCTVQDPYTVVIKGTLLSSIEECSSEEQRNEADLIEHHNLFWPKVGWEVVSMPGAEQYRPPTYDENQFIPTPVRSRIPTGKSLADMVLQGCEFAAEGEGEPFTIRQYMMGLIQSQRLIELNCFRNHLYGLHRKELEDKIALDEAQATLSPENRKPYVSDYAGLIRDNEKESAFLDTISNCSKHMGNAYMYQSACINQMNPTAHATDRVHIPSLIPFDEVSSDGMLMTSLSLHERCELLVKAPKGEYWLQESAKSRNVIMTGDALSVKNHRGLRLKIYQKLTQLGNEDLVDTLAGAHDSITLMPGDFHEDMHRLDCGFRMFYPGFWQPLCFELSVKRVNGDPVKGGFQAHENFALKLLKGFKRYRIRCFIASMPVADLRPRANESPAETLLRIEKSFREYCESWETSDHEPSRLVALSIKFLDSYSRCRDGIRKKDFALREKEGCDWLAAFKFCGKNNYVIEACERIEKLYGPEMKACLLETLRRNRMAVLTDGGRGMAQDEVNELVNAWLKVPPSTPYLSNVVKRSRHLAFGRKARVKVYGLSSQTTCRGASEEKDVLLIEKFLLNCNIFRDKTAATMTDNYFWSKCKKRKNVGSSQDRIKEEVEMNQHEQRAYDMLISSQSQALSLEVPVQNDDDTLIDDNSVASVASVASSVMGLDKDFVDANDVEISGQVNNVEDPWDSLTDDQRADEAGRTLKTLGMGKRKDFDPKSLSCMFEEGFKKLKKEKIVKVRQDVKKKRERQIKWIYCAVKFFKARMKRRREQLKVSTEMSQKNTYAKMNSPHDSEYRAIMKRKRAQPDT